MKLRQTFCHNEIYGTKIYSARVNQFRNGVMLLSRLSIFKSPVKHEKAFLTQVYVYY